MFRGDWKSFFNYFCCCRWMPLEDLPAKIVPFKSKVYQAVHEEFGPIIQQRLAAGRLEDAWWGIAK